MEHTCIPHMATAMTRREACQLKPDAAGRRAKGALSREPLLREGRGWES